MRKKGDAVLLRIRGPRGPSVNNLGTLTLKVGTIF